MFSGNLDLNDLRLLMRVVEYGSYTAASKATGIPKSTLSQRVAALEEAVGTGLLRRNSRSLSLTEAGEILLPHARTIDEVAREAEIALNDRGVDLAGTLRVTTSFALSQFMLAPLLPKFLRQHPKVSIRVDVTNRYVDLIKEGYDLGVRAHGSPLQDSGLAQRVIARTPWAVLASPGWIKENQPLASPSDLEGKDVLFWSVQSELPQWTLRRGGEQAIVSITPRLSTDDMATLRTAALEGGGVTALPHYICRRAVETGELASLFESWELLTSSISLLTPPRRQSSRLTKAFSAFLASEMSPFRSR